MSEIYFISDLHLGHDSIPKYSGPLRGGVTTVEDHDDWIVYQWNSVVRPSDTVYVLGDVAFTPSGLVRAGRLNGNKYLIMGNHDHFNVRLYEEQGFKVLSGLVYFHGYWLSHAPVHPEELRGRKNIHGHVHARSLQDDRYINVCVEALGGLPLNFNKIQPAAAA